mmetsp:Transcript_24706/g.98021  ORF Transcript_24706/g.98021 Transcript_24706/m.98021 type:complete len:190 (+) Transcript_24706:321-890(+)
MEDTLHRRRAKLKAVRAQNQAMIQSVLTPLLKRQTSIRATSLFAHEERFVGHCLPKAMASAITDRGDALEQLIIDTATASSCSIRETLSTKSNQGRCMRAPLIWDCGLERHYLLVLTKQAENFENDTLHFRAAASRCAKASLRIKMAVAAAFLAQLFTLLAAVNWHVMRLVFRPASSRQGCDMPSELLK